MSNEITRNKAQEIAVFAVYDVLTYANMEVAVDLEGIISGLCDAPYEECDLLVKKVVIAVVRHLNEMIPAIQERMRRWKFSRLNRVEQAILLVAYAHYFYLDEGTDRNVIIDVAVRLSKQYLDEKDYRFVNGILDNLLVREHGA